MGSGGELYHALPAEEVVKRLDSSYEGLSDEEASRRLWIYGYNELRVEKRVSPLRIWAGQFKSPLMMLLLAATAISYAISTYQGEFPVDSILIFAIVMAVALLGFVQEYRAERALEALRRMLTPTATVVRGGVQKVIPARELVPGDVLVVSAGDKIAADCRLIDAVNLQVDEAPLTGESAPVQKMVDPVRPDAPLAERRNMLFAGTSVTYGKGRAVVVATGMNTELGKIAREVSEVEEGETPLERRMREIGNVLGRLIVCICAATVAAMLIEDYLIQGRILPETFIDVFLFSVALAVAAVPEALPAIVTGTLAIGMREMARRNALVRRMPAVETLGCVTVICSDKTGTLTKGEMTVRRIYVDERVLQVTGVGYAPEGEIKGGYDPGSEAFKLLMLGAVLCNDSTLEFDDGRWMVRGDPTEGALVVAARKAGLREDQVRKNYARIGELPFSSERKRMTTIHLAPDEGVIAFMKGAPEVVLERCRYIQVGSSIRELDSEARRRVVEVNEEFASNALRNIAVAYKPLIRRPDKIDDEVERDFIFLGIFGMIDPPREDAIKAIEVCKRVGIKPIMITGDHKLTAVAVAREMGIYREGDLVLTGEELEEMSDEEYEEIVDRVTVYARVSPLQKLRIVRAWKRRGAVVAVTGDGVNDAPAIKQADIGIAMGITGTEVAKEASDMILLDDNFATIVKAIEMGRWIYDNIKKYLVYLLQCNLVEIAVLAAGALIATYIFGGEALLLLPAHILYINLATDGLPALALGLSPPERDVMNRPPRDPREPFFSRDVAAYLAATPAIMSPLLLSFFFMEYATSGSLMEARTMLFLAFVSFELIVALNCASLRQSVLKAPPHKLLIAAVIWETSLLTTIVSVPVLRDAFHLSTPSVYDITLILAASATVFVAIELVKFLVVRRFHESRWLRR